MPEGTLKDYLNRRAVSMVNERQSFDAHYRDLSQFFLPRRGRFFQNDRNKGDKRYGNIINSRGTQALRVATSGLLAGIMSPSRPWFGLSTPDRSLMEFGPVKQWLHMVELILREIFNQGNLYNMAPVMLEEVLLFGTAAMMHVDDFEDVARFYTFTAGDYYVAQNDRLEIDTLMRKLDLTVRQIVESYGLENVSKAVKREWDKGNYDNWYPVVHMIEPNPDFVPDSPINTKMAWRSVTYEPGNNDKDAFLSKSGFRQFPLYVPRWNVTGNDVYGTNCPGMTALGDVKALQIEERRKAQAIDKMVNPPLKGPASLKNVPIHNLPGTLTAYDDNGVGQGLAPIYEVRPQIGELLQDMQAVERRIDEAFYADMFLAINNMEGIQPRNELDLTQRNEERLLQLGPALERFQGEFLDGLIDRTFNQALRAGILPPAPEELQDVDLKVQYISSLAMAQRAVATNQIERMASFTAQLVGAGWQDAADKFNADQAQDEYADAVGVAPGVIRTDDEVSELRTQRAEQEAQQLALQQAEQAAGAAQKAAGAFGGDLTAITDSQ